MALNTNMNVDTTNPANDVNRKNIPAEPMAIRSDVIITIYFLPTLSAIKPMGKAIINPPAPAIDAIIAAFPFDMRSPFIR